jgi:tetratricopeptide (TPR) repeat protein
VNELSRWTDTIFVGEPTGERVNFYGDTRSTQLPNSGLTVRASWLWWQNLDPRDTRDALYPDLAADMSFADYAGNHDPAMAIIRSSRNVFSADEILVLIDDEGMDAARTALLESIHDPVFRYGSLESEINDLGYRLLADRSVEDAIAIFQVNVDEFPDSWNAYDSLGEAWEKRGDLETALDHFRKSVAINPASPSGLAAIERLENQVTGSTAPRD